MREREIEGVPPLPLRNPQWKEGRTKDFACLRSKLKSFVVHRGVAPQLISRDLVNLNKTRNHFYFPIFFHVPTPRFGDKLEF